MSPHLWALLGAAIVVLAGAWWLASTSPVVDPSRCYLVRVQQGKAECGGPCTTGKLPCAPPDDEPTEAVT
jgi:hypothetical protein